MRLIDKLYDDAINGVPVLSQPITQLADDYLTKHPDPKSAAKSFINYQIAKCTTSGFITGLGGLITLPVAIPANLANVLYVQIRMIACIAYMGGYDIRSDQVQTLIYACLAGLSLDHIVKQAGIKAGVKFGYALVRKIPGKVVYQINKRVGFKLVSRFSTKSVITIGKAVPIVGGFIGGGFDLVETKIIGNRAYKMFILNDFSGTTKMGAAAKEEDCMIDAEDFDTV